MSVNLTRSLSCSSAQAEDKGIDRVAVYSSAGNRVAQTTGLDTLLREDFDIVVNDFKHRVNIPEESKKSFLYLDVHWSNSIMYSTLYGFIVSHSLSLYQLLCCLLMESRVYLTQGT